MPEAAAEPALSGLRLNLRIVSVVIFNFASYLTIGLPLAVLPGYVHDVMGFSAFWAGLVISLQYFATLLSRPHAGRYADTFGPKSIVVVGLCGCFLSGLSYLLAAATSHWPLVSLALLCLFGWSLTRPMSLVERLARLQDPALPPVAIGYTRRVTQVWCGFFVINGALAAFTIWHGDLALWSLYNGLISYALMGGLMGAEYLVRRRLLKRLAP